MAEIFNWLYVIAAVLLLFGAAVFFHELGHFWVARRLGMKVEEFAIGFGPKLYSRTRDGVLYSVRAIPAGGFVKLPQMITAEAIEGSSETGQTYPPASPWARIAVAFAGPMMNVLFAFVIAAVIYLVGLPQLVNPSVIGVLNPESEEYRMGIREDDRIVEVNGEPVKSWQDVHMATVLARTNVLQVVIARDGERMTYSLDAKENEVLGGLKMLNLNPQGHPKIVKPEEGTPAAEAGLEPEDVVVSFAGVPIYSQTQLIELIQKRGGQETKMEIERGEELLTMSITPRVVDEEGRGQIGAIIGSDTKPVYELMRPGPTPWAQVKDVWNKTIATLSALIHSKETGVGAKDLSGPVGILAMLGAQVNTDYRLALSFLVLLNINLAILNLLPVPVLDGGHILMALIEKIIRRPLSVRLIEYTTTAFALLLISFMLYVSFHDIKRFSLFRSMFRNDARIEQPAEAPIPETGAPSE